MKRVLILMLLALPMTTLAQKPNSVTRQVSSRDVVEKDVPKVFGEIMMTEQQGRPVVRVIFDSKSGKLIQGKQMRIDMDALRSYRFESVLEAVNSMSAMGWEVGSSYVWETRTGNELHIAVSKDAPKMLPPDLTSKETKEGAGKEAPKSGRK
ncbi:MAG: hypothetical protein ACI8TS_000832 [Flavobacteriales bacterium]|jgi:hypothetical protein